MIFASYICVPGRKHPDLDRVGEASVNCWLRVRSFAEAKAIAEQNFRGQRWKIVELEEIWRIPKDHYQTDDAGFQYYEQALIDREVYVFHQSPKYPVYCVEFEAVPLRTNTQFPKGAHADVKYWVVNERISETADCFDNFWGKEAHIRKALSLGKKAIKAAKWRVTAIGEGRPINHNSFPKDPLLIQYYEEAEEYGDCLSFWTDVGPS